jgi:hypothetical protein
MNAFWRLYAYCAYSSKRLRSNFPCSSRKAGIGQHEPLDLARADVDAEIVGCEREQRALDQLARREVVQRVAHRARVVLVA